MQWFLFLCIFVYGHSLLHAEELEVTLDNIMSPAINVEAGETPADPEKNDEDVKNDGEQGENVEVTELESSNKLADERLKEATMELREELTRVKLEREIVTEQLALEAARRQQEVQSAMGEAEERIEILARESKLAQLKAEKLSSELKSTQSAAELDLIKLKAEIETIEAADERDMFADSKPVFLADPLRDDGTLVISDRRIPLNGMIIGSTADYVTSRIDYWNNRDKSLPIFIVIDDSPGGSVMAGYRILKAMEASEAPIHVVVKSFAASMAACIVTLAEHSYAYPNAIILHHQISSSIFFARLNLTEQKEFYEESQRWWKRLAEPVAKKMGITTKEFIEKMYAQKTSGDWSEFGNEAVKLKWVNHIVEGIVETSITLNPDSDKAPQDEPNALVEQIDNEGKPFAFLPRLNPKDVYFLYNPDSYYRVR